METFAHEEGALVGVLCPVVVVKLAQHVGQLIQVVWSQPGAIVHRRICRAGAGDELCVDFLVNDDVGQLGLVIRKHGLGHARLDNLDLVLQHVLDLAITHTVPEQCIDSKMCLNVEKLVFGPRLNHQINKIII